LDIVGEVQDWAKEEIDDYVEPEEEAYPLKGIKEDDEDDDGNKTEKNGLKSD
jgi:hypothetical protein